MDNMQKMGIISSTNTLRPDGKHVRTVRDTIIEVDENGNVVDDWRLYEILDPYRSTIIKALDQGVVCLNIDASKAGKTLSDEELAKMDESDKFGDIAGIGRNWAHIKGGIKNFQKYLLQPVDKNGNEWFYPVTSLTQYEPDKDSIMVLVQRWNGF